MTAISTREALAELDAEVAQIKALTQRTSGSLRKSLALTWVHRLEARAKGIRDSITWADRDLDADEHEILDEYEARARRPETERADRLAKSLVTWRTIAGISWVGLTVFVVLAFVVECK